MWGKRGETATASTRPGPPVPSRAGIDRFDGDIVVPRHEVWTVEGLTVYGGVRVEPGASLRLIDSVVNGSLECAVSSRVIVRGSRIHGSVGVVPAPVESVATGTEPGGLALVGTRVGADVRCTGLPRRAASLILGEDTLVDGSVLTAHTDLVDHGATVRVTVWNTGRTPETIDLTGERPTVCFDRYGIAS